MTRETPERERHKEHHPALPEHPGKQLKDRPPQQIVRHCGSCIIAPITSGSCSNPRFTGVRPFFGSGPKEPHHHYCAIGWTRACLLIRQDSPPRTHGVSPMGRATPGLTPPHQASTPHQREGFWPLCMIWGATGAAHCGSSVQPGFEPGALRPQSHDLATWPPRDYE
ncbi:hypothetical protein AVEN_106310-1 [Araneus ventricosus]|uniref:Uncharacterized protein n=1 Tax=Araneus ventricosus TaxID=182803 RepID=A0A4Y2AST1_ARAVE|nr:hypothetical protein AVEN_106310-1 [Araneus ventricosus]